jgi:hypothetical protein
LINQDDKDLLKRAGGGQFPRISSTPVATVGTLQQVLVILIDQDLILPAPRELEKQSQPQRGGIAK